MFGQGYVLGAIITALGLYSLNKWKQIAEREENSNE